VLPFYEVQLELADACREVLIAHETSFEFSPNEVAIIWLVL